MATKRRLIPAVLCALVLTHGLGSSAQGAGDLDLLTTSVPPNVVLLFDSSGSMRTAVLPEEYLEARGEISGVTGRPSVWFNGPDTDEENRPAAFRSSTYNATGTSGEDFERTCRMSRCQPVSDTIGSGCEGDDDFNGSLDSGETIQCWNVPGGCDAVPSQFSCSVTTRLRERDTPTESVDEPFYTITMPDWSFSYTTKFSENYIWWMMNEIYLGNTPVPTIGKDRNQVVKDALHALVDDVNEDGEPAEVEFGLARYSTSNNGGFILVPPAADNKATLLAAIDAVPADGSTPLSESLVDVGRYIAGADRLGAYPQYDRDLSGNSGAAPPSPIESSCEKTFVIVLTDGLPTEDANNHYGSAFATSIGDYDGDGLDWANDHWLDDVAKYLHDNDLRPTMTGQQNVFTYTVGFTVTANVLQLAANKGHGRYFTTSSAIELAESLEAAIDDIIARNTSLTSATVPSSRTAFGDGFYTAYFLPVPEHGVWRGHLEAYTFSPSLVVLDENGNPAIDPVSEQFIEPRFPHWDAAKSVLDGVGSRSIYTTKGGDRTDFDASNIDWTDLGIPDPNTAEFAVERALYDYPDPNAITDPNTIANDIVAHVRGTDAFDEDEDGDVNEPREWVFGDVFHSNPIAVGPPTAYLRLEPGYGPLNDPNSFLGRYARRERVLYVGANDGMYHAFAAGDFTDPDPDTAGDEYYTPGDGTEKFGYIPGFLMDRIKLSTQEDVAKLYYVDGTAAVADVWVDYAGNGVKETSDWTTVAVVPMRQGGEGLLALDITDPTASTAGTHGPYPRLMWELTDSGLGQTWSRPIITRVKMRASFGTGDRCGRDDGDGDCLETWVAVFGAGYRPEGDPNLTTYTNDPNDSSYTEKSRGIYIVSLENGTVLAHVKQDRASANLGRMKYSLSAEPAVIDVDFDGFADVIYIGDLGGQLWKWDISETGVLSAGRVPDSVWPAGLLFEAPVADLGGGRSRYHSIFQGAAAAYVDSELSLSFASGERTELTYAGEADPDNPDERIGLYDDNNRFWVLKDEHPTGLGAFPTLPIWEESLPSGPPTAGHGILTDISDLDADPDPTDAGYFFRVPDGEKFITNHLIFAGAVATLSYVPDLDEDDDDGACSIGGQTNQWAWELESGGGSFEDPEEPSADVRSLRLGNGAPTDPRLTVSQDRDGNVAVKITEQTSTGQVTNPGGLPDGFDPVHMVYWRQNF